MSVTIIVRKKEYLVAPGQTIEQAIQSLGLQPETYLSLRNGEITAGSEVLREGDHVKLVPIISGGA